MVHVVTNNKELIQMVNLSMEEEIVSFRVQGCPEVCTIHGTVIFCSDGEFASVEEYETKKHMLLDLMEAYEWDFERIKNGKKEL